MTTYLGIDIDYPRDENLSDHARTLLREAYMTPEEKSPQEAYARASVAWSGGDMELAQRLYDAVSNNWFMFSSPVLSNAPFIDWSDRHNPKIKKVNKGLPISCFLSYIQDTVKGLVDHTTETRWLSVLGGGVGGHWSAVRSASDVSPGTIPFLHTVDADMLAWKQGKCYTPDTEILTETGWKFFPELKSVDNVAVFDPVTKKITFEQPFEVVKEEHTGPMVFFNGPNVNLIVTPNHSMVIERGDIDDEGFVGFTGKLEKVRADNLDHDSIWRFHLANGKHEDNDNIIIGTTWYEGFVYCAVVRTGMIVVRRQGGEDYKIGVVCGNTRKGSYAAYMDISHPDILEFIKMRVPVGGGDHNRLCLNLNHAVNIPDAFMEAVRSNGKWDLVDPNDGKVRETVPARQLWEPLLEIRYRTGEPYLNFIDTANRALPQEMKDAGLFLRGSNLCFAGDTLVAVADGRNAVSIQQLAKESQGKVKFPVYAARKRKFKNQFGHESYGKEWKPEIKNAVAFKTGTSNVIEVFLSNGTSFKCTQDHLLALHEGDYVKAKDSVGCKIQRFQTKMNNKYRKICNNTSVQHRMIWEFYNGRRPTGYHVDHITPNGEDFIENLQLLDRKTHFEKTGEERTGENNPMFISPDTGNPLRSICSRLENNARYSGISDENLIDLARSIGQLPLTPSVWKKYAKENGYPQSFSKNRFGGSVRNFIEIVNGTREYLPPSFDEVEIIDKKWENPFDTNDFLTVEKIQDTGDVMDVFDLTVEDNHNFFIITNGDDKESDGILVHNCNEIHQPTNEERTAVCCLASPNIELFDEWKTSTLIEDMTTMLDNIITYFVDNAPTELAKAVFAASQERSIGIGQMGFHSLLQRRGIPFESEEARELNIEVAKFIDRATSEQSLKLGRERGPAPDVAKSGYRNAMRTAIAPNANSASLVNTSPSIEPWKSNGFVGRDRVGTHLKKNVYLEAVLERYGKNTQEVWDDIIGKGGSVQHLDFLTHREKQTFKTAIEIDMSWVVRHAADRQPYVTQGQSVNLFFPPNANKNYLNRVHWQAWEQGLKGLYYCRTESSKKAEVVNEKVERVALKDGDQIAPETSSADECLACHA